MEAGLAIGGVAVGNTMAGAYTATANCGCCGERPPPPPECGRQFALCVGQYEFTRTFQKQWFVPNGDGTFRLQLTETVVTTYRLRGGPYKYISNEVNCPQSPFAAGLLPVTIITERTDRYFQIEGDTYFDLCGRGHALPAVVHTRRIEDVCLSVGVTCPQVGTGTDTACFGIFQIIGQIPDGQAGPFGVRTFTQRDQLGCERMIRVETHNQWSTSLGVNTYTGSRIEHVEGSQTVDCGVSQNAYCARVIQDTSEVESIAYSYGLLQDCHGIRHGDCSGTTETDCFPPRRYFLGDPCPTNVPGVPPVVAFRFENVTGCGVEPFGGYCYKVSPASPQIITSTAPANISDAVVDGSGDTTCCDCLTECPRAVLSPSPCWQNARRINGVFYTSNDRPDLVSPPFISGVCCCRDDDIITIAEASTDFVFVSQGNFQQNWRLCRPITFRRNEPNPLANFSCPVPPVDGFTGFIFSIVTQSDGFSFPANFGAEFTNLNQMACEWTSLPPIIEFRNPQNSVGFFNNFNHINLPCPADDGGVLGGWRLVQQDISVTCDTFLFEARYEEVDSGTGAVVNTAYNKLLVRITRNPNTTGQPCTGGCAGSGGGSIITGQGVVGRSGCSTCGKDGL